MANFTEHAYDEGGDGLSWGAPLTGMFTEEKPVVLLCSPFC